MLDRMGLVGVLAAAGVVFGAEPAAEESAPEPRPVEVIREQAASLRELAETDLGRAFFDAAARLPEVHGERSAYWNGSERKAMSVEEAEGKTEEEMAGYRLMEMGEFFHYNTFYGTPVAYGRAVDLAGSHGLTSVEGARVFDYGFGGIGHLRMLASLGAHCTGVEVLELLDEYYVEGDFGVIENAGGADGSVRLLYGSFPGDAALAEEAGSGYSLFLSKNTLKLGYVHPEREADPRFLLDLGVDDETYLRGVHLALRPGGLMVVYNLYPTQRAEGEGYLPWATGGFPFDRELTETIGFDVLAWNVDDGAYARQMGEKLGWGERMDLETDLHAMYTVLRRR